MTGPIAFAPNRTSPSTHVRVTLQSLGGSEEVGVAPACCTALPPPVSPSVPRPRRPPAPPSPHAQAPYYEEAGASYVDPQGKPGLHLYVDPFLPRLRNATPPPPLLPERPALAVGAGWLAAAGATAAVSVALLLCVRRRCRARCEKAVTTDDLPPEMGHRVELESRVTGPVERL